GVRVDAEGIRRAAGGRPGVRAQGGGIRREDEGRDGVFGGDRAEPADGADGGDGHVPGFVPSGAWAENSECAAEAAGCGAGADVPRDAGRGYLLRERGDLQRG